MKSAILLAAYLLWAVHPFVAEATTLKSVNLEQIVAEADRIFLGTCIEVEDTTLPGSHIPITLYTFSVEENLKGPKEKKVVIRQVGVRKPRIQGNHALVWRIPGMPSYPVGQEVVLFLRKESSLGLTSPVGLMQGAFRVEGRDGKKILQNGFQNRGLLNPLSPEAFARKWGLTEEEADHFSSRKGPLDRSTFINIVRKMVAQP